MRLWNLSSFENFEGDVLLSYGYMKRQTRPSRPPHRGKPSRFTVALGIAALAANMSVLPAYANSATVRLPITATAVAQSVGEELPPLAHLFSARFQGDWTEQLEAELLGRVEASRASRSAEDELVDASFFNQNEDLDLPKLISRAAVSKAVRRSKPSR